MKYNFSDISAIIQGFENASLPATEWTHEKHLIMALWYVHNLPLDEAIISIRSGIIYYNLAQGNKNNAQSGYHETLTLFWIAVIKHYISTHPNELTDQLSGFLASPLADKTLPFQYYSSDVLFSTKARARWVPPNLNNPPWLNELQA